MWGFRLWVLMVVLPGFTSGGSILFYMAYVSKSVRITYLPLVEELSDRGHQVTLIDPFEYTDRKSNVRHIQIASEYANMAEQFSDHLVGEQPEMLWFMPYLRYFTVGFDTGRNVLQHPEVRQLLHNGSRFDVAVNSAFFTNELGYFLAHRFNATLALYQTLQCSNHVMDLALGQPHNPAFMSSLCFGFVRPHCFWHRLANTLIATSYEAFRRLVVLTRLEADIHQHYGQWVSLLHLERDAGLAFNFGHPLLMDGLKATAPNYVSIGMMNCRSGRHPMAALPKELHDFLNDQPAGRDGVIYVSFGTVLSTDRMSNANLNMLLQVFKRLKQKVLWKWDNEQMPGKPDNVMISSWIPQQEVLAHPNVRLFVTHGGQSSCQESLCHEKPMVVVPLFGDQMNNGQEMQRMQVAVTLPFAQLDADALHRAIDTVLQQSSFTQNAVRLGKLLKDDINSPLDRAIWWIEYAIRHPGMQHFRSPVHNLSWPQYFLLDVIGFLLAVCGLLTALLCFVISRCLHLRASARTSTPTPPDAPATPPPPPARSKQD